MNRVENGGVVPHREDTMPREFGEIDLAFNAVAWTYVHLRGRHGWPADETRRSVVALVLNGVEGAGDPRKERT